MIDKSEIIFAVDEDNNPIAPVERRTAHKEGIWHRTTDIIVLNSQKEILCHKRSMLKDTGKGLWDSAFGGHMAPGIEAVDGAIQELGEESGLLAKREDLKFIGMVKYVSTKGNNREFRYAYVYHWEGKAEDIKFEVDEISEVKWVSTEVLKTELKDKDKWSPAPWFEMLLNYLENTNDKS
jgi:isopentenyldiphosphate isomerase